jgi:sigma-70, region 4|nr:MAG TPA: RNA polymerase sigma factor [Caudoviricetes sp.]
MKKEVACIDKEQLSELLFVNRRIDSKMRQIKRLNEVMEDIGLITKYEHERVQHSGGNSEDLKIKLIDCKDKLRTEVVDLIVTRERAKNLFKRLKKKECMIMEMRYIEGLQFKEIAKRTNYTEVAIFKIHQSAVKKLKSH